MVVLKRVIDVLTLVLAIVVTILLSLFPVADQLLFSGERLAGLAGAPHVLRDSLVARQVEGSIAGLPPRLELVLTTALILLGTLTLMLPASWVYMSIRRTKGHSQVIVQTLIILPIVVAGIILVVRNSLALAFSLAGVVAAVRFRTSLSDARDIVFIFLAIAVGFAAGVQVLTVAAVVSVVFNFVLLLTWRYDFGRNPLEPTAAAHWEEPLKELATTRPSGKVPDRDLVLALSPKKVEALEQRFSRVRQLVGPGGKKPRFNAILAVTTRAIAEVQPQLEKVLTGQVKRWALDEVVTNEGKPSELYYLVRMRKGDSKDDLLTAIRSAAGEKIVAAEVDLGAALADEDE